MTNNADFKAVVRARVERAGESYTQALAYLRAHEPDTQAREVELCQQARREQETLVGRWFDQGQLRDIPTKRKARAAVLLEILRRFEPGRDYAEKEFSEILATVHPDYAYLRREFIVIGYFTRHESIYRMIDAVPLRTPAQLMELPTWEACWLPGFLAGTTKK